MKTIIIAALAALITTACGGGSGVDPTDPAACYVNGQRADASACRMQTPRVDCSASGVCG